MAAYRVATRIESDGEVRLSALPFSAGEEVEILIVSRPSRPAKVSVAGPSDDLPPLTRRLVGAARGVTEEDYRRYLEDKHR